MSNRLHQRTVLAGSLCLALLAAVLLVVASWQNARAQAPTPTDDEVNRIAHQLYCPVCENTPLDVCPTEACRQWRDLIRQQLSEGKTEAQIQQYFVEQYGARVLAEPPRTGLNWIFYILPGVIILAGIILFVRSLRGWTASAAGKAAGDASSAPSEGAPDDYVTRLEDEVKRRS